MKIAVIGAGLAGLAVTYFLVQKGADVTLYDQNGIGNGATQACTGLMHPFPGKWGRRVWRADEGMKATEELVQIVENSIGEPIALRTGVLRLGARGAWIPNGMVIFSEKYIKGLWNLCEKKATFVQKKIASLSELNHFDAIVLAAGFEALQFAECKDLPLKGTLGQSLLCKWLEPLSFSILTDGCHISPTDDPRFCFVGSTYESSFTPDPKKVDALIAKIASVYPKIKNFEIVEIRSGIRISPTAGYRPLIQKIAANTWIFSGLGSKGLLYHALFAQELCNQILR